MIPIWDEIERFNPHARAALRRKGLLGDAEVMREAVKPLGWTEEQREHWNQYQLGDRLLFVRDTRFFRRGTAAEVVEVLPDGVRVRGERDRVEKLTRKQRGAFEVGRAQMLAIAAGDRLLIRGREEKEGFANGDFKEVARVNPRTNEVTLTDGHRLPPEFKAWTYGHALTAYRAQGSTAEESLLVLGEVAARALAHRQFYVANTRYRGAHRIYVSNRKEILAKLEQPDFERELATEYIQRRRLTHAEFIFRRRLPRMLENVRYAMRAAAQQLHRMRETIRHHLEV